MTMRTRNYSAPGFTLIEMLLVVAIIAILAAIVAVSTTNHSKKARRTATWTQAENIKTAIAQFEMELGRYPKDLNELVYQGDDKWPGPFLDSETVPKDAWGYDFKMSFEGKLVRVTSPGPDGQFGNDDDLWK